MHLEIRHRCVRKARLSILTLQHKKNSQGKEITHIRSHTRFLVQFLFKLCDKRWDFLTYMYVVPFEIGLLEDSPLFYLDENILVPFDKVRVEDRSFTQRVRQIS
jgi:hypothetical protein